MRSPSDSLGVSFSYYTNCSTSPFKPYYNIGPQNSIDST